ncbi:conserved hypothetical protein [Desulfamplus magnetovallimortis]|uniref:Putative restriction endonuclease domain-containing protein n=1 Tax=Desulfamplus magnetovallimortis TaxID=1246637 RepID=A0A1W1HBT3_9BACT|nr:Uma2 family endonuclease [Desulfamplus magnetovallimortis]SLM29903.1 conserved hypothetical protein [Desulfamplus magnetovallimortis]
MNALPQEATRVTPEEYLELERTSEVKYEYFDGEVFAMVGASLNHNRINRNMIQKIGIQLEGSPCEALSSDMRVKIEALEKYTYPDIAMVCGDVNLEKKKGLDTLLNPIVIIEILSKSTEAYDRGTKFQHYQLIPSLQEYILVSQHDCRIEKYVREAEGKWIYSLYGEMGQSMTIASIGCELLLSDIYYRVEFE